MDDNPNYRGPIIPCVTGEYWHLSESRSNVVVERAFPFECYGGNLSLGFLLEAYTELSRNQRVPFRIHQVSNEKNPGCFVYIGDYTTQLYRDYNKPL